MRPGPTGREVDAVAREIIDAGRPRRALRPRPRPRRRARGPRGPAALQAGRDALAAGHGRHRRARRLRPGRGRRADRGPRRGHRATATRSSAACRRRCRPSSSSRCAQVRARGQPMCRRARSAADTVVPARGCARRHAAVAWLGLIDFAWSDYDTEAAPAMKALSGGDVSGFFQQAPAYGGSLILRAPFALAASALGGGELAVFRAVSIPCLVAVAILALVLAGRMLRDGRSHGACAARRPPRGREPDHDQGARDRPSGGAARAPRSRRRSAWPPPASGRCSRPSCSALRSRRRRGPCSRSGRCCSRCLAAGCSRSRVAGTVCAAIVPPLMLAGSGDAVVHGARMTGGIFTPWQIWWPLGD